jgi:phosphoribosylformimino-5-aminoimidazole carboxamide ribotide isomerase
MIIFPAVDVKDGQCVRLVKGEFSTVHTVAKSIDAAVNDFAAQGAVWIHMVDLDGAGTGQQKNVQLMTETVMKTQLKVQIGGGIRTIKAIEQLMKMVSNAWYGFGSH